MTLIEFRWAYAGLLVYLVKAIAAAPTAPSGPQTQEQWTGNIVSIMTP
jgi:hypothetical protein